MVKVVICGPPHSGKSLFINSLVKEFPEDSYKIIHATINDEGINNYNETKNEINIIREKGDFTKAFVEEVSKIIDIQELPIIIVDVGGRISPENKDIYKHCDLCIVISSERYKMDPWVEFAQDESSLKCIATLYSVLPSEFEIDAKEEIEYNNSKGYYEGTILELSRGNIEESIVVKKVAEEILKINRGEILKENINENNSIKEDVLPNNFKGFVIDAFQIGREMGLLTEKFNIDDQNLVGIYWPYSIIHKLYSKIKEKIKTNLPVRINGIKPNFILSSISKFCNMRGVEDISSFDYILNRFVPIRNISKKVGIKNSTGIEYSIIENSDNIFLELKTSKSIMSNKNFFDIYEEVVLPELNEYKKLYISARIPNWFMASIVRSYNNHDIYIYYPANGFLCIYSNDESRLGKLVSGIDGIDINKYFEDRKNENDETKSKGLLSRFIPMGINKYLDSNVESNDINLDNNKFFNNSEIEIDNNN